VLHVSAQNPHATIIASLPDADQVPSDSFDCIIFTQTLHLIYDFHAAIRTLHRILKPGGVLLATVPVASRICDPPLTDYWRFTPLSFARLVEDAFGPGAATVQGRGSVLSQIAFLAGLAAEDLTDDELAVDDERFPLLVCARAVRAA
jgi:SAM-dependent methyltransferase